MSYVSDFLMRTRWSGVLRSLLEIDQLAEAYILATTISCPHGTKLSVLFRSKMFVRIVLYDLFGYSQQNIYFSCFRKKRVPQYFVLNLELSLNIFEVIFEGG